ncbi:MAG: hypothetical protein AAGF01_07790 [Cyanobacteria bacterium P01_G01_bin.38]
MSKQELETPVVQEGVEEAFEKADLTISGETAIIPDWSQVSLADFQPMYQGQDLLADSLTVGDLANVLNIENITFLSIILNSEEFINEKTIQLNAYPFLAELTVGEIAGVIPRLQDLSISKIKVIKDLLRTVTDAPEIVNSDATLGEILSKYPNLGSVKFKHVDLESYAAADLPGFLGTPVISIPGWQDIAVREVLGLAHVPLDKIGEGLNMSGEIVSVGVVDGEDGKIARLHEGLWRRDWSTDNPLTPFGPFMTIYPYSVAEAGMNSVAFFNICSGEVVECNSIGPFPYLYHANGDPIFIGQVDVSPPETEEKLESRNEVVVLPSTEPKEPGLDGMLTPAIIGTLVFLVLATGAFIWLVWPKRKEGQSR